MSKKMENSDHGLLLDEDDFDHYNLFRSEDENFVPDDSTLIATLMENSYVDEDIEVNFTNSK